MQNEGTCSIEGCDRVATRRGWCSKHYQRWKRHGDPLATVRQQSPEVLAAYDRGPLFVPIWDKAGLPCAYAQISPEDVEEIWAWRWSLQRNPWGDYAYRQIRVESKDIRSGKKGRQVPLAMHRQIMGLERGDRRQVDHINGDTLDNRRSNLRIATPGQNGQNRKGAQLNSQSGIRGVGFHKPTG